jgi:hypothetical protein
MMQVVAEIDLMKMKQLGRDNLFRARSGFGAEGRLCAFMFWFSKVQEKRKML